jgi:two-component system, NarL family, sensor kinase
MNLFFRSTIVCLMLTVHLCCSAADQHRLEDSINAYKHTDYSKSIEFAEQLKELAQEQHNDTLLAEAILAKGVSTYLAGKHDEALQLYLEAVQLFSAIPYASGLAMTYNEMGILYQKQNKSAKARQLLNDALTILQQSENDEVKATSHNNLGLIFDAENKTDSAEFHFKKALTIYTAAGNALGMSYSLDYLSGIYVKTRRYEEAASFLQQSLTIRRQLNDKTGIAIALNNLGELYFTQSDYDKALAYFEAAGDSARNLNFIDLEAHTFKMRAELFEKTGDYKNAYQAFQQYNLLSRKISDEKRIKNIEEFEAKYESGKKEKEIIQQKLQLSKRTTLIISLCALLVISIFSFYLIYNRYKSKQEKKLQQELLEAEERRTKAMLESEENERQRLARELHDGVGQLLTATKLNLNTLSGSLTAAGDLKNFSNSLEILDDSIREIRNISHNMMPSVLIKYGLIQAINDFVQKISQTKQLDIEFEVIDFQESSDR